MSPSLPLIGYFTDSLAGIGRCLELGRLEALVGDLDAGMLGLVLVVIAAAEPVFFSPRQLRAGTMGSVNGASLARAIRESLLFACGYGRL